MPGLGTLLNVVTVLIGASIGTRLGTRLPNRLRETVMHGLGLFTMVMGVQLTFESQNLLVVLGAVLIGGLLGEWWRIDLQLERLGSWLEAKFASHQDADSTARFIRGFVSASLIFCIGPMTVVGSIQDGLGEGIDLLAVKSVLDAFAGMAFASTMGVGVVFAGLTVLIYQGALTLLAAQANSFLSAAMIGEMTAAGGLLIMGIGLLLLEIKEIRLANFLPALAIAPIIVAILDALQVAWA
jgi:uncharacterized membrane protein YqgA involved in biofilm formation